MRNLQSASTFPLFSLCVSVTPAIAMLSLSCVALIVASAALVNAANYRRVTCPDGVNTATNEAVRTPP